MRVRMLGAPMMAAAASAVSRPNCRREILFGGGDPGDGGKTCSVFFVILLRERRTNYPSRFEVLMDTSVAVSMSAYSQKIDSRSLRKPRSRSPTSAHS